MSSFSSGFEAKGFAKLEASYGTIQDIAATDAVSPVEPMKFTPDLKWDEKKEVVGSASQQGFVKGMESGKWQAAFYGKPAAAGTAPDIDPLLEALFGTKTVNASTSVVYTFSDSARKSVQLDQHVGGVHEVALGAVIDQCDIEVTGNEIPKFNFQGPFARYGCSQGGLVGTGGVSNGASIVPVNAAHKYGYRVGGLVTVGTSTGHRITAVTPATPSITVTPVISGGQAEGASIIAYSPSQTLGGTVIGGIDCALSLGGTEYGFISAKISIKSGKILRDKEASSTRPTGVLQAARRVIDIELQFYLIDRDTAPFAVKSFEAITEALSLRIGPNTAGSRITIAAPVIHWMVAPKEIPGEDVATFVAKARAIQSAAAGDELSVTFH
jgi:hypothetical protein